MSSYNKVKPKNKKEAKIWNKYNNEKYWDWIKIRYWPANVARGVIEEKLNYQTRWQLLLYLVGNGMDPEDARIEIKRMGSSYFDNMARLHIDNLIQDMERNSDRWKYWDESAKRTMPLRNGLRGVDRNKISTNEYRMSMNKKEEKEFYNKRDKEWEDKYESTMDYRREFEKKWPDRNWFEWYSDEEK